MSVEKIEKLEELIHLKEGQKIVDQKISRLTAPGENYGSLMLSVDITIENADGRKEEIKAVAKMVPPNEEIQKIFNTQVTFRNEIGFYKNVVPLLQNFQREHGVEKVIDFFPKYIGGRINLSGDDSAAVDSDAVLLLENLKVSDFCNLERTEGFDLEVSKMVVKDLAYLHAVPLALKLQKPEVFEKEIKCFLAHMNFEMDDDRRNRTNAHLRSIIESIDGCKPFVSRVMKMFEKPPKIETREPFATISHNDVWVNNTMVKTERGKPTKNVIVDFQVCDYGSPAKDLFFLLFSSVKNKVLEKNYDYLVEHYHKNFIAALEELHCDTSKFSFKQLETEINIEAINGQMAHVIFMFFPIFAPRGEIKDLAEFDANSLMTRGATDLHKQKLAFVIKEFIKRDWL